MKRCLVILVTASLALAALTASTAAGRVARRTRVASSCSADEKAAAQAALDSFLSTMTARRKAYFRRHHDKAHRRAFLKRQRAKLKALQAAAACEVESPPPPPAPPPPSFQAGHYAGKTSQLEDFEFDVSSDGSTLMNLVTGQINESCNGFNIYGGNIHTTGNIAPISSDGNFTIDENGSGTFDDGTAWSDHLHITGHIAGTSATGTLLDTLNFTYQGTPINCTSNPQTWTTTRTG